MAVQNQREVQKLQIAFGLGESEAIIKAVGGVILKDLPLIEPMANKHT